MSRMNVLAFDLGASNGRGIAGEFDGSMLVLTEIHRFPNTPVSIFSNIYWDILNLYNELKNALSMANRKLSGLCSVGIDTWGLDFGLLDSQGNLLGNPRHYRDSRTINTAGLVFARYSEYEIFSMSGMNPGRICTLFQLVSMQETEKDIFCKAQKMLFMPDLLAYFFTNEKGCEPTMASTSLLFSPYTGSWIPGLADAYNLGHLLPDIGSSGSVRGFIEKNVMEQTGIGKIPVISVAQHDTASAIATVPVENKDDIIYISCGTWSVLGTTVKTPLISREVLKNGFNNEIGYDNEIMFVKNITGLWILQECVKGWEAEGYKMDYESMNKDVAALDFDSYFDVDEPEFSTPGDMEKKICHFCKASGQKIPEVREEIYKCIILSLAVKYRECIEILKKLTAGRFKRIHIVGGGSKNGLLCMLTAKLTGMQVVAGPAEATAIGNILAQLIALGEIKDIKQGLEIVKQSFPMLIYNP